MLRIVLTLTTSADERIVFDHGEIGNVSNLNTISSYEIFLPGRDARSPLTNYPRWSEPVRGLLARCIDVTVLDEDFVPLPDNWAALRVDIGIQSGYQRGTTRLAMCRIVREEGVCSVGHEEGTLKGFIDDVQLRKGYSDIWELAQHALNLSMWGVDAIPPVKSLVIKKYDNGMYIRSSEIPEPLRSAFERRQRYSGRPCIGVYDAHWSWDLEDFIGGTRDVGWL